MTKTVIARRPRKMAREPIPVSPDTEGAPLQSSKPRSKASQVLNLLRRSEGATLAQLIDATGWLPHTTRAALTGLRKKGHAIAKDKLDGVTRYAIAPEAGE